MYEKVNPMHPDKVADRIAGAIVDYAYSQQTNPRVAVEVLIGHGNCYAICESSVDVPYDFVQSACDRISKEHLGVALTVVPQDIRLASNQSDKIRCGDNGIFKGVPVTDEQREMAQIARDIYEDYPYDGKYILDNASDRLIICQSHAKTWSLQHDYETAIINPLGDWTGGVDVDSGATNRKLGSDMGRSVTGGGLSGKDLSKSDVSVNIYAFLEAQRTGKTQKFFCAIGDTEINGVPYSEIIKIAKEYVDSIGGFEKLSEWGLV